MNINASTDTRTGHKSLTVTAQGQAAEQLAQLLKLSGLGGGEPQAMEEEYANEPNPETQGVEVQLAQGNDLNRPKNSYPKVAGGDNPMNMREARELAEIEQRLTEALAEFKVGRDELEEKLKEEDIEEGLGDNLRRAAAAGVLGLGLAAGGNQLVKDYHTAQDIRQTQQQAPTVKIGSKNYKVFSQDLASKGPIWSTKVARALKDKIVVTDGSGNQYYLGVSSNTGHFFRLLPTSQTNVTSPTVTVGNKQMSVISPELYKELLKREVPIDKLLVKDNSGNSYYLQVGSNNGHQSWLVPIKGTKGVSEAADRNNIKVFGNRHGYYVWSEDSPILVFDANGQFTNRWSGYEGGGNNPGIQNYVKTSMQPVKFGNLPKKAQVVIGRELFNQGVAEGLGSKKVVIQGLKNWISKAEAEGYEVEEVMKGQMWRAVNPKTGGLKGTFHTKGTPGRGSLHGSGPDGTPADSGTLVIKQGVAEGKGKPKPKK
jgi:hypothetical protein